MVALLLFSALGIAVWSGLASGQNLVRRSIRTSVGTARLLQLELYLRKTALRVRTPYWAAGPGAEATAGGLRVPWLDGDSKDVLIVEWQDGLLRIRPGEGEAGMAFGPFPNLECAIYKDDSGRSAGIEVSLVAEEGQEQPLVVLAPFGGSPFPVGTAP
jgi:hypothetical protein